MSDAIVYPPERSATVECHRCGGKGARSAIAGHCFDIDGGLWHEPGQCKAPECHGGRCCPKCSTCDGTGRLTRKHYAYCKRRECVGCLPTIAELERMPLLDVFAEMLARCIAQSPDTKTHEGAMAALRANRSEYETVAYFARRYSLLKMGVEDVYDCMSMAAPGSGADRPAWFDLGYEKLKALWETTQT